MQSIDHIDGFTGTNNFPDYTPEEQVIVNERLIEYTLVKSLLKTVKNEKLLTLDEYSGVLKKVNARYKDVRE